MVGAARHDREPALADAHRHQVGRHQPGRDDQGGPRRGGPPQRRLVPARPAPRRRFGMPAPGHVVHGHDQLLRLERRSRGEASDTECTTSNPAGARDSPWSQARVKSRPGSRDVCSGRPNAASGSADRRAGARLARSATSTAVALRGDAARPPSRPRA